ncbi:uncharacterized protein LOC107884141 [Acyrthosiphon pisum]|uniref:Uncharacterized protein n=1 Tax=Acyrthosiphon pisum TaxID=7029 RepID=A0A8R2D591_ACYPI|nr:uncharacterized protein LOC107884141 [Acyrthosiphon pisum]|eukprot:XP_016661153.1 PREDICTED: uncharacterized protein LOC107884141 [Acyrthosiphon pisum]
MQEIVDGISDLFSSGIVSFLKNMVMPHLKECSISEKNEIDYLFDTLANPFFNFKTEYQRFKFFEDNNLFFKPKTIVIGHTIEKKNISGIDRQIMVPVQGHLLSMKQNLRLLFEFPGVFEAAFKYTEASTNQNQILSSFLNGTTWKSIKHKFSNKIVFPIFLYYDDVEIGNPLGSHSGIHKMGCVYYTIPAFPPEYLSTLDNIFAAFLFHSSDLGNSKFNNKTMFASLINDLIDLQENGITITVNSNIIQVYFVLGLVLGDNLGLNSILGFVSSFSANYCCRICRSHKTSAQKMLLECTESLRSEENYMLDVLQENVSETGVNELCVFNAIPNYHVIINSVCDFMHDVTEGVARYDMAVIITQLINDKYFTLIVGELVPIETPVWQLYIALRKIVDICCAKTIQSECSHLLDQIVAEHNRLYLLLSGSNLKPKFHMLTHYGRLLIKNGPLILTSCIRFEAKHKILKAFANSIPCRINLGHTLANKIQLQMASRYLTMSGLGPALKMSKSFIIAPTVELSSIFLNKIPTELKVYVSWLDYKGILYQPGMVLVLEVNLDNCIFGEIVKIFIGELKIPYFIYKQIITVGFDSHYYAYQVELNSQFEFGGCYLTDLPDPTPTIIRTLGNGINFVSLRYAL